jgi:hypothetical protein
MTVPVESLAVHAVPPVLGTVLRTFPVAADPRLDLWSRWPYVSWEENESTDSYACESVSPEFADFATSRGLRCALVRGEITGFIDPHWWTRVWCAGASFDVDWTARQFHDLDPAHLPQHADLPSPLVWQAGSVCGGHPVDGLDFDTVVTLAFPLWRNKPGGRALAA